METRALLLALLFAAVVAADDIDPLAGRGGSYLRLGVGARAQAMGNAQAALPEPTTVFAYWNPAMACMITDPHVAGGGYRLLSLWRQQGFISYANRIPPRAAIAVALLYHGDEAVPIFDSDGNYTYDGGFSAVTAHVGVAYKIRKRLSAGLATTIHNVSLRGGAEDYNRMSVWEAGNLDLSVFYQAKRWFSFGLNLKDIRSGLNWAAPTYGTDFNTTVVDELPLDLKIGAAFRRPVKGRDLAVTYDADVYFIPSPDQALSFYRRFRDGNQALEHHLGAEYFLYPELPLRLGVAGNEGFSCGAGFYFLAGRFKNLRLDYVFSVEKNGSGVDNGVSWTYPW